MDDPVGIEELTRIEIGDAAVELGMEGIDDLGEGATAVVGVWSAVQFAGALRVRAEIDRVGEGIGEIKLHTVAHGVAQDELTGVVAGAADVRPCIERRELPLVEARRGVRAATEGAECIESARAVVSLPRSEGPLIAIDILRCTHATAAR